MNKVKFLPSNIDAECEPNETLFELAERVNVKIENSCSGQGTCSLCKVKIISGAECLNETTRTEVSHMGNVFFITRNRLSCCAKMIKSGEVVIEVPNETA